MKTLLLLLALSISVEAQAKVSDRVSDLRSKDWVYEYDAFKDIGRVHYRGKGFVPNVSGDKDTAYSLTWDAWFAFKGNDLTEDLQQTFYIRFATECKSWCFLNDRHDLIMIASGGDRIPLGKGTYSGDVKDRYTPLYSRNTGVYTQETLIYAIDRPTLVKLANSTAVMFQIGRFEGVIKDTAPFQKLLKMGTK